MTINIRYSRNVTFKWACNDIRVWKRHTKYLPIVEENFVDVNPNVALADDIDQIFFSWKWRKQFNSRKDTIDFFQWSIWPRKKNELIYMRHFHSPSVMFNILFPSINNRQTKREKENSFILLEFYLLQFKKKIGII
jgi:hypothetical protein